MNFEASLEKYFEKTVKRLDDVTYNATVLLFTAVVFDTAVDIGKLRGAWTPGVGEDVIISKDRIDPTGEIAIRDIQDTVQPCSLNFIVNTLPYAPVVEYGLYPNPPKKGTGKTQGGFSIQSPFGMISPNMLRWPGFVDQAVKLAK